MDVLQQTQSWIKAFVIGLNLCPFAAHPFQHGKIKYRIIESDNLEELVKVLLEELEFLNKTPGAEVETTLIIHPNLLNDFLDYNDFLAAADELIVELGLEGEIQIASFHPEYQYAGELKDAISNYVTRSPFPMLHLLREASVTKAIEMHPDTSQIPLDNIQKLEVLGLEKIKEMLR